MLNCGVCGKDLDKCTCPDIDERMFDLFESQYLLFRVCYLCGRHYARCKCKEPDWTTNTGDEFKLRWGKGGWGHE